jgi:hypothetical protein
VIHSPVRTKAARRTKSVTSAKSAKSADAKSVKAAKSARTLRAPALAQELSGDRAEVVNRMWRAAEAQVRDIEERLLGDAAAPLERERDARVLAVLAKTLRELSALDSAKSKTRELAPADDDAVPRDMDELRRSLARKLEALIAGRKTDTPGGP